MTHKPHLPQQAIDTLKKFTPCLDPHHALVDRSALEEVLSFLARLELDI